MSSESKSLAGKNVVILGAAGVIGMGVTLSFLHAGATVVGVSRDQKRLDELKAKLGKPAEHFTGVVGEHTEATIEKTLAHVKAALKNAPIDHVVCILGMVSPTTPPTQSKLSLIQKVIDEAVYPNFVAAHAFIPELKNREGSSFTLVSGGYAHFCPDAGMWTGTVKNAMVNAFTLGLNAEVKDDKVRVNTICVHFAVAPVGGDKNQLGWPGQPTERLGKAFVALAQSARKGEVICLNSAEDAEKLK